MPKPKKKRRRGKEAVEVEEGGGRRGREADESMRRRGLWRRLVVGTAEEGGWREGGRSGEKKVVAVRREVRRWCCRVVAGEVGGRGSRGGSDGTSWTTYFCSWLVIDAIHYRESERQRLKVPQALSLIDTQGALFFLGILVSVSRCDHVNWSIVAVDFKKEAGVESRFWVDQWCSSKVQEKNE
ncbi:hypothetical protein KSS87_017348 [Heliosperma pusillum]|nr:hypothetical protein KSS87_017348 [Heliosperma pusillum]